MPQLELPGTRQTVPIEKAVDIIRPALSWRGELLVDALLDHPEGLLIPELIEVIKCPDDPAALDYPQAIRDILSALRRRLRPFGWTVPLITNTSLNRRFRFVPGFRTRPRSCRGGGEAARVLGIRLRHETIEALDALAHERATSRGWLANVLLRIAMEEIRLNPEKLERLENEPERP